MSGINRMPSFRSVSSTSTPSRGQKRTWDVGGSSTRKININILCSDGVTTTFYVPVDLPMQKLLKRYCDYKVLEYRTVDFRHEGHRVQVRRTADELHMVDGDQIDALVYSPGA